MQFREFQLGTVEYHAALQLREAVLRTPLGLSFTAEEMADEPNCFHLGGFDGSRLIAVLLLKPIAAQEIKMRQVAVHPDFQGRGLGAQLIAFAESFARQHGYQTVIAHARETASGFYRRVGYALSEETFLEQTIPHRLVTKRL